MLKNTYRRSIKMRKIALLLLVPLVLSWNSSISSAAIVSDKTIETLDYNDNYIFLRLSGVTSISGLTCDDESYFYLHVNNTTQDDLNRKLSALTSAFLSGQDINLRANSCLSASWGTSYPTISGIVFSIW